MGFIQPLEELEEFQKQEDPWGYENDPDDVKRKDILLHELPKRQYKRVLDIGCGQGFITRHLPGDLVIGSDISHEAIKIAKKIETDRLLFVQANLYETHTKFDEPFDLVLITGVLYKQYIGRSNTLIYRIIDKVLAENGILVSVHIDEWYYARFPYLMLKDYYYNYRQYTHRLEVYIK